MKERIGSALFSLSGLSLTLGVLGFLSGIVQLFIDTSAQLSVKWFLLTLWIALSLLLILMKVIYDLSIEKRPPAPFEAPIKFLPDSQIFVIRRNDNFLNSIVVGCYLQQEDVDTLVCVGVVHIVQEKVIQIKVHGPIRHLDPSVPREALSRIVIRPVVPIDALNQFTNTGGEDE